MAAVRAASPTITGITKAVSLRRRHCEERKRRSNPVRDCSPLPLGDSPLLCGRQLLPRLPMGTISDLPPRKTVLAALRDSLAITDDKQIEAVGLDSDCCMSLALLNLQLIPLGT